MLNINKIKLVIWDLDDTLWNGTLSEGNVELPDENIELIHKLIFKGIMNSVCSKNDFQMTKDALQYAELWDLLIFPRISWQPKGENIQLIIKNAQLRAENVLFIDDNRGNLEEAVFYNPGLMTLDASEIPWFRAQADSLPDSDKDHVRLKQYKVLETRKEALEQAANNVDFLRQSKICVTFIRDVSGEIDRIYDLVQRTNQLNFTKQRGTKEELASYISRDYVKLGLIRVTDRYGDYGIVGFYAIREANLEHFLFSCRIMGMGVEQWVYAQLGFPQLTVTGEVASILNREDVPGWINQTTQATAADGDAAADKSDKLNILMTGGCDLMSLHYYLQDNANIDTEFDYVSPKTGQYATSMHTEFLVQSFNYSREKQERLAKDIPFYDERTFNTRFFNKKYDIVVTSILNDCTRDLYDSNDKSETIVFGDNLWPLKTRDDWLSLLQKGYQNVMTKEMCLGFYNRYKSIGGITPERLIKNLEFIRENLNENTLLIIMNAVELDVVLNGEVGRHLRHIEINKALKTFCDDHPDNVALIDINKFVRSRDDLADTMRHYQRRIYFEMAQSMLNIINAKKYVPLKIAEKSAKTPMDRFMEILPLNKHVAIYGATRQGVSLFNKLKDLNPIMIDHEPVQSGLAMPTVYTPEKLTEYETDSLFVIVMDRHENSEAIQRLQGKNLRAYDHYVIWPNYVW